jgi:uncharacterized protein YcfJ
MKAKICAALLSSMIATSSYAQSLDGGFQNPSYQLSQSYATIIDVQPIYVDRYRDSGSGFQQRSNYQETCYDVRVPVLNDNGKEKSAFGFNVITGAVIGGLIGSQFGGGDGQTAMTALGATVGAGRAVNRNRQETHRIERRCEGSQFQNQPANEPIVSHYLVTYIFDGNQLTQETTRRYYPGQQVLIQVQPTLR